MKDIVARMKALPDLANEQAWEVVNEGAREIERLRTMVSWADQNPESRGAIFREILSQRDQLLEAMKDAMETIKALHGPVAWDIYERSAPEMQRYKAAIAAAS